MIQDIYSMLNEANISIDEYKKEDFNDIEKKKLKNNFSKSINKNKSYKINIAVVAIALILVVGLLGTDAGAQVLSKVSEDIASFNGLERNLDSYKTVINQPITDNGITIQLNEVILDENDKQLIISTNVSSDRALNEHETFDTESTIYINNKKVKFISVGGGLKNIDEYTTQDVCEYDLSALENVDLSGELHIKILYTKVMVNYEDTKRGTWKFEFKTNGDQLKLDTKVIKLDNIFILDNGEKITLEKYTDNALGENIYCKVENFKRKESYDIMLKGTDDLGNEVEFYLSRGSKDSKVLKYNNIDGNINENAKILILTPYAKKIPEKSGEISNDFKQIGEEFKIDLLN